jgi:hypothetical protein
LAGARIGEIIARNLTLNHSIERLVWSRQIANGYSRYVPEAAIRFTLPRQARTRIPEANLLPKK